MSIEYRLLTEFRSLFEGKRYRHRDSSLGDYVAMHFYEDLAVTSRSSKLLKVIQEKQCVLNVQNRARGINSRRGDGTFGEIVPGMEPITDPGYIVSRGPIATVDIGLEVKILAKAMIKQIDRVIVDLRNQVSQFRMAGSHAVCIALIGINHAEEYTSYEGDRMFKTTGRNGYLHLVRNR